MRSRRVATVLLHGVAFSTHLACSGTVSAIESSASAARFLRRGRNEEAGDDTRISSITLVTDPPVTDLAGRDVIIKYKTEEGLYEAEGRGKKGRPHRLKRIKALAGFYTERDIADLSARPDIEYIEDDAPVKRFCNSVGSTSAAGDFGTGIRRQRRASFIPQPIPYGINMTQADQISAKTNSDGSPIITVCIVDSGLDAAHEDIQKSNVMGASFGKKVGEWNDSEDPHGTHVAGTLAALGDNNCGVVGVESGGNLRLLIARVFDDDGSDAKTSSIVEAVEWCADNGANVINMSLGNIDRMKSEAEAMAQLWEDDILVVAAAGNQADEFQKDNYPASFDEVISVGMVGEGMLISDESQKNKQLELAAPGVSVLSTTKTGTGELGSYIFDGMEYEALPMEYTVSTSASSPNGASGVLIDCGYADEDVCPSSAVSSQPHVCLIKRGAPDPDVTVTFVEKIKTCEAGGGIAAIIYNNIPGGPIDGTLTRKKHGTTIPAVGISLDQGLELKSTYLGQRVTVVVRDDANYGYMTGTSMATPHVAAIAAIIWSHHPHCSNAQIRKVMQITALDQGDGGRDSSYGFGIVRGKDALDYLDQNGCPDVQR